MFMTLLKHEWRATRGVLGLMCLIILSAGAAMGGCGFYVAWMGEHQAAYNPFAETALSLLMLAAVLAIAVCCVGGVFYLIWRFYCSRFTDEGYLTFTLPVSIHQNLLSSIVGILWGCVVILLAATAAMLIAFFLLTVQYVGQIDWGDMPGLMAGVWSSFYSLFENSWQNLLWVTMAALLGGISRIILLMLAVTIGSILAKKHKILAAVGVYWLISLVHNITYLVGLMNTDTGAWFTRYPVYTGLVIILAGYFLMYWLVDKKLNLN